MTAAWVLGSGGLLGGALCRELRQSGTTLFSPAQRLRWTDSASIDEQIPHAVSAFAASLAAGERWEIFWAAGVGTMGSPESALAPETHALSLLLRCIEREPRLPAGRGAFAFASSAGAVYAGSGGDLITESTPVIPTNAYGREKLKQEELLRSSPMAANKAAVLLARISTLYGLGQASAKPQGLLTHIAKGILRNQPITIYVPLDTIRDYIAVEDAAAVMIRATRSLPAEPLVQTRIVASERPTTIAEIVTTFRRLARRNPRIVTSASSLSSLYSRRVQFKSTVQQGFVMPPQKSLVVGIAQLLASERAALMRPSGERP